MPRVVIVGAGYAGIAAAQTFAAKLKRSDDSEVVVLEKNRFFYHTLGASRAYADDHYVDKMFIPFDNAIPRGAADAVSLVHAVVTRIDGIENIVAFKRIGGDDKAVETTETMTFDYLILATGFLYTVPIKPAEDAYGRTQTEAEIKRVREAVAKAQKILVVGGGSVGCEVAGDIAAFHPDKDITILEARDKIVAANNVQEKFRDYLLDALDRLKIKVILGERLEERLTDNCFERRTLRTDQGTEIESDLQLLCGGFHPVSELVHAIDPSLVDERGSVRVNARLQLDNDRFHHIFALGDVTNHGSPRLAYVAFNQGRHVAAELVAAIRKQSPLDAIKSVAVETSEKLIIQLGQNSGVSEFPFFGGTVFGDTVTRLLKGKDVFASRMWWMLGAKVPN